MKLEHGEKVSILLAALAERYNSLHIIRSRVENTGVWVIGLSLGASGWLLQSTAVLSCAQRSALIAGVLVALIMIRFVYLGDLRKGFQSQQRAAARIERALHLYDAGAYDDEGDPIYPVQWRDAGGSRSPGRFFQSTHALLYVAAAFLVVSILASGSI